MLVRARPKDYLQEIRSLAIAMDSPRAAQKTRARTVATTVSISSMATRKVIADQSSKGTVGDATDITKRKCRRRPAQQTGPNYCRWTNLVPLTASWRPDAP